MKRNFFLFTVLFLVILFAMGRSSYAQAVKPIELKLSHWMSPLHNLHTDVFTIPLTNL